MTTHLLIPDVQAKPGVSFKHLEACGNLIVELQPDVIVNIGDFFDMPSLSSHSSKKEQESKRFHEDIEAGQEANETLLSPVRKYNANRRKSSKAQYRPKMIYCIGNHENRITRFVENNPKLEGEISIEKLGMHKDWKVVPFLEEIDIDGITYAHYFSNDFSDTALGTAKAITQKTMKSATAGHKQILDYHMHPVSDKRRMIHGLIAGAFYEHDEAYKGPQSNQHWRGVVVKHFVKNGNYDPQFIHIDNLKKEYL